MTNEIEAKRKELEKGCRQAFKISSPPKYYISCGVLFNKETKRNFLCPKCENGLNTFNLGVEMTRKEFSQIICNVENPYPEDIFLPLSKENYTAIHNLLLTHFNISLDKVSADLMRIARNNLIEELKQSLEERNDKS